MQAASGDAQITYTAQQDRAILSSIYSREGIIDSYSGAMLVTQRGAGANYSVDVAIGRCAIRGDDVSDQGTYVVTNSTVVNVAVPTSTSASRTHLVIARIRDKLMNPAWTTYSATIELLADTSSIGSLASAIPLATITVPAGSSSVTNAMINFDARPRASVGTPALTGVFGNTYNSGSINSAYGATDSTRPLTCQRTPDGWVSLAGWLLRTGATTNTTANATYYFDGGSGTTTFPPEFRPPGIRDFIGIHSSGEVHFAIYASGALSFRFAYATTLTQNQSWWSFDGCGFRI